MAATILIKTAREAEKLLKAVGAKYMFTLPTGEKFGNLKDEAPPSDYTGPLTKRGTKPKRKSLAKGFPYGFRMQYIREKLDNLDVGDVEVVSMHEAFESLDDLRKTIASVAFIKWGADSHKTAKREDGSGIEILRTA